MIRSKLDKLVQLLIPPSLVLLMVVTIIELFYDINLLTAFFIDLFDIYVVTIFAIDLYYRWQDEKKILPYLKKYWLDIIATIPFGLIFLWIDGLALLQGLRGVRGIRGFIQGLRAARAVRAARVVKLARLGRLTRIARYGRLLRLLRFGARAPRFLRARKNIKETKIRKVQPHEKEMKGVLSFKVILLVTVNSIMGTGIWFLTASGAKHAGPASLISWGILSLISIYIAMCFAELTAMFPKAGGVYEFAKQTYGRFWSFVIGWTTSIAGSVTIAMLLLGALQYLIPIKYATWYVPLAIALILLFNFVAFRGMQTSTYMLISFAIITLITISAIIIPGFFNLNINNFIPFFVLPNLSIILAIFFIAETFFGWESAIFLAAETKNPTKVMPRALVYGTLAIASFSFLLAFTALGVIPWQQYAESVAPLSDLGEFHFGFTGRVIFTLLVFTSVIGAVASWIVTAPRLLMSIAEDKLFFVQFSKIHPKYKSPYVSIAFQVLVISALVWIGSGSYETLLHMLIPLILVVYSAVLLSVVILRYKKPHLRRPYKVIFGKTGPLLTILFMLFLLIMFIKETHGALDILRISVSLILFGIPAYFFIEMFYDSKYVPLRRKCSTWLLHHFHRLPIKKMLFKKIINLVGPFTTRKTIAIINSRAGAFTEQVIKKKIPFQKIYVANILREEIELFRKKISIKDQRNILTVPLRSLNFPPHLKNIDIFISFNDLRNVEDVSQYLLQIQKAISKGGSFCFYVSYHFLNVSPNAVLLENKKEVIALFKKAGLKALYLKRQQFFLKEIFIYGKKKS